MLKKRKEDFAMEKQEIKLSIVVAVYNLEQYLPRCLEALIKQTMQEIEILCVDDGSTDSAPQIIEEYQKKYPEKIKVFHKPNGGEFTTRNYGLERAKGEYVTFVDTDDWVEPNWAQKLYEAAKNNDADLAVCGFERIDLKTNKVVATNMTHFGNTTKEINGKDDDLLFINPAPWNKIYKREIIKDLRFLPFRGFNDTMFLASCYTKMKKIAFTKEVLYHYYLRYDSQIHTVNQQDVDNLKKYLLEVKQLYKDTNQYEEMKYLLDTFAFLHLGTSVMYRVSYDKSVNMKQMLKHTIKYLDENFSNWRKSPFLTFRYASKKGFKHIAFWGVSLFYKLGIPRVYIRVYRFLVDVLKIDIKF